MYRQIRRLFAASSAIVMMGALGPGVGGPVMAQAASPSVTFSSQPAVSSILAHYAVTPETRGGKGGEAGSASGAAPSGRSRSLTRARVCAMCAQGMPHSWDKRRPAQPLSQ